MPSLTIKDIPRQLHRQLKARAKANHRSLNKEVVLTLQKAGVSQGSPDPETIEHSVRQVRSLFRRPVTAREITDWKRRGRL